MKHGILEELSFAEKNISSALCNIVFGTLAGIEHSIICKPETHSSLMIVCGCRRK
jgi:hypothetical protein